MSEIFPLPIRKEVQDYLRSCEHLLGIAAAPSNPQFSEDELHIIAFYMEELTKILTPQLTKN